MAAETKLSSPNGVNPLGEERNDPLNQFNDDDEEAAELDFYTHKDVFEIKIKVVFGTPWWYPWGRGLLHNNFCLVHP